MRIFLLLSFLVCSISADTKISQSIDLGVKYLLENQNPDGSWGSAGRTKDLNIYAPGPGAHLAFKTATTALDLLALASLPEKPQNVKDAILKSTAYLIENHQLVKRVDGRWVGNIWSHTYIVKAFLKLRNFDFMSAKKSAIDEVIKYQIKQLKVYQYLDGGWGYYDFAHQTDVPSGSSTSFLIASCLIVLKDAEVQGFEIDKKMISRAISQLKVQRRPDGNFLYSHDFKYYKGRAINRVQGSLGRVHGCMRALHDWKDPVADNSDFDMWLGKLIKLNGWLDIVRKRPVPHEGWYQIAGYFYYYGHYYAAENLQLCKNKKVLAKELADILISKQEKSGAWFDFPLYDYGHYYGTAYALLSLISCQAQS